MSTALPPMIESLRRSIVVEPLRNDPRHTVEGPLGLSSDAARAAIGWGQANFDKPHGELSSKDRVMLYAYWNQKRHLEELTEAFTQLYKQGRPKEPLIVIDIGCGPFTGGLALAGQLDSDGRFEYIGVDRSISMRQLGKRFAAAANDVEELPTINHCWFPTVSQIEWLSPPSWGEVIVIVSFLLASDSLDVEGLIEELHQLLPRISFGAVTVIYTNSDKEGPNYNFPTFKKALLSINFELIVNEKTGRIQTASRELRLRYALFRRQAQSTLPLKDD